MRKKNPRIEIPGFKGKRSAEAPDGVILDDEEDENDEEDDEEVVESTTFPGAVINEYGADVMLPTPIPISEISAAQRAAQRVKYPAWIFIDKKDDEE
jgi:hypothetical protein